MKVSNFPFHKTLDDFDFSFQPTIDERQIRELAGLAFVALGVALGIEAVKRKQATTSSACSGWSPTSP